MFTLDASVGSFARLAFRSLAFAAFASTVLAGTRGEEWSAPGMPLKITWPEFESLTNSDELEDAKGRWTATLGGSEFDVSFFVEANADSAYPEPEDMAEASVRVFRKALKESAPEDRASFSPQEVVAGPFGFAAHAALVTGEVAPRSGGDAKVAVWMLAGLAQDSAFALVLSAAPPPDAEIRAKLDAFLRKGVVWSGPVRDPKWTDDDARARWTRIAPKSSQMKLGKIVRSAHYIVMSNTASADRYAKKLEERYATIKKQFPFAEYPSQRLLPVFYFRTADETRQLVREVFGVEDTNSNIDSYAADDFLVTSADSDDEYEEFYDAVEQLWTNRVRANGGGLWLSIGMRELIGYPANTRTVTASQLRKGRFTPLATLLDDDMWSSRGETEMPYGEQSAFFVDFLRDTYKDKFTLVVRTVGTLPDDDLRWVAETLKQLVGADLDELEKKWIAWCAKRKK
jgi:hypothetical protein